MLSILIPTNDTEFIVPLLNTIEEQSYHPEEWEIIVATDGCKKCDEHLLAIQEQYDGFNIYSCPTNMGIYKTINGMLNVADGDEYLIFGSDDVMHKDLLKTVYEHEGDIRQFRYWNLKNNISSHEPTRHHAAGAIWLNRFAITVLGGYKSWRYSADTEFIERAKSSKLTVTQIDKELFWYRHHEKTLTSTVKIRDRVNQRAQIKWNGYRENELYVNTDCNFGRFI